MSRETKVLRSWKEIAAYLGKGVRTAQRWEQLLGLPVQRPKNRSKGSVVASTDELDQWLRNGWEQRAIETNEKLRPSVDDFRRLRQQNRELTLDLTRAIQGVKDESEALVRALSRSSGTKSKHIEKRIRFVDRKRS